jgi:hypothetical protein
MQRVYFISDTGIFLAVDGGVQTIQDKSETHAIGEFIAAQDFLFEEFSRVEITPEVNDDGKAVFAWDVYDTTETYTDHAAGGYGETVADALNDAQIWIASRSPKQSQAEFFARPDVRALQDIQKRNPFGSEPHKAAFGEIKRLASLVGAEHFFGDYE